MNREEYKKSMSGVRPSEEAVERMLDMTYEKRNNSITFKKIICTALAFAIIICSGIGINTVKSNDDKLTVIVAYANETMSISSLSKQKILYSLYAAPIDDEKKKDEQYRKVQKDYNEILEDVENSTKDSDSLALHQGIGKEKLFNVDKGEETAILYTTASGSFAASKNDYTNIKKFTVKNESKYGVLQFETSKTYELFDKIEEGELTVNEKNPYEIFINHKSSLTGDELRKSQKEFGNAGYTVLWEPSEELKAEIAKNPNFDITNIKDKITFTFEDNDGNIESASVNITFDKNGHMSLSENN